MAVAVVTATYLGFLAGPVLNGSTRTLESSPDSGILANTARSAGCQPGNPPTALEIPNEGPGASVAAGDHVSVTFEFNITKSTVPVGGLEVFTPTVFVTFPLVGGGSFPITFNNHTFRVSSAEWTPLTYNKLVTSDFEFDSSENATLTTQKVGTMANATYGTIVLEWRWTWNVTFENGSYDQGPWTIPTSTAKSGAWLRSIFQPAPYVELVASSPASEYVGATYEMSLGGDVSGRSFYVELENAAGTVKAFEWQNDTSLTNATFEANIVLLGRDHVLTPGAYLVHVHDSCLALLYSKRIVVSYPPSATVEFLTSPSNCGWIMFDGSEYRDGQNLTVVPSATPEPYTVHSCKDYVKLNQTSTGAVEIVDESSIVIGANGTLTANSRVDG